MITLKRLAGSGLLIAGTKVHANVEYTIEVREGPGGKRVTGSVRGPSVLLGAAWRIGRSKLVLETGESLNVVVLSLVAEDVAPLEIDAASVRIILSNGLG